MYKTPMVVEAVSFVENRRHVSVFQWIYNNIMIIIIRTHVEKAMATHSSTLAWKIPWKEEPGRLQSMGSLGVGHD